MRLSEWAAENFYLSSESSYIEGRWEAYPYQNAILDCFGNDDIRYVDVIKSARVGYTKMVLAAIGFFAQHKKRNQGMWQPIDADAEGFSKTDLDPAIRDIPAWRSIFPSYNKRSKNNTIDQKIFSNGKTVYIRGGKSAKNYRRISVDVGYADELSAFDEDIDKEGDAISLIDKRLEGATFPKLIAGSTPKTKGICQIETQSNLAQYRFKYFIPCPHCDHMQPLAWGGKDVHHGIKWQSGKPATAAYLCCNCGALFLQSDYLQVWQYGRWQSDCGAWLDADARFYDSHDRILDIPEHVAFHIWSAYSPQTTWQHIVSDWLKAQGKPSKLKTFVNTTRGETWEEDESEKADDVSLYGRREEWSGDVPEWVMVLTVSIDTQDDRFEIQTDGWGVGEERATIDYARIYGDPGRPGIWEKLKEKINRRWTKADGTIMDVRIICQDHGGHYGDEVVRFSKKIGIRKLIPVKGYSIYGKPVANFPRRRNDKGVYLTMVGADTAKDILFDRMELKEPGPGYWHWPVKPCFDEQYFKGLTAEERIKKHTKNGISYIWDAMGRANEPLDLSVYGLVAIRLLQQVFGISLEAEAIDKRPLGALGQRLNG